MLCPRNLEILAPARSIEQAIDELGVRLEELPGSHPDVPMIQRQIEGLELHLLGRCE